jgi:alcohol dehydrogenase class IV
MIKKLSHDLAIGVSGIFSKLLPDRIPVTFIGPDASRELCESISHLGSGRVLIVTDATLVELGLIDRITEALDSVGLAWSIYSGVEPDPTFAQVEAGHAQLTREGCEVVLAVGGGSSMDAAKVIAAMATNPGPAQKLEGMMKVKRAPMPLFAIPTTAGTGSEVTLAAVVSDTDTHAKKFFADPKLLPLMTALDPSLMTGLPAPITAATGMDALTHAVESFLSRLSNETTEKYAEISVRLVFDNLPVACTDGNDLEARKAMALASYYGGLAFTRTSVGYVHAIAHTFGAYYRTPHGLANAIALPHVLAFSKEAGESRLARAVGRRDRMRGRVRSRQGREVHRGGAGPDDEDRHPAHARCADRIGHRAHRQAGGRRGPSQLPGAALHEPVAVRATAQADGRLSRLRLHARG